MIRLPEREVPVLCPLELLLSVMLLGMALAGLTGCGFTGSATSIPVSISLRGTVLGGEQPISGAAPSRRPCSFRQQWKFHHPRFLPLSIRIFATLPDCARR